MAKHAARLASRMFGKLEKSIARQGVTTSGVHAPLEHLAAVLM
jgi:hypothetical protein